MKFTSSWWSHQMETFDVFFDLCLNNRLSKHSWGWWFETLSSPLWRLFNGLGGALKRLGDPCFPTHIAKLLHTLCYGTLRISVTWHQKPRGPCDGILPITLKAINDDILCFLFCYTDEAVGQIAKLPVIWDAIPCDATVTAMFNSCHVFQVLELPQYIHERPPEDYFQYSEPCVLPWVYNVNWTPPLHSRNRSAANCDVQCSSHYVHQ